MAFYFATAFEDLGADTASDDFMDTIRSLAITFMILGLILLVFMTMQSALMETAAGQMTRAMQSAWFEALLRQDMAYYDVNDMAGQAIILSTNGAKYKSKFNIVSICVDPLTRFLLKYFAHIHILLFWKRASAANWPSRFSSLRLFAALWCTHFMPIGERVW
jgi:ABC-type multidrug transport system fused ATPase/permease subunit